MLFPTLDYLVFLVLAVGVYWALPRRHRLAWLGLSSLLFYASWSVTQLGLLIAVVAASWVGANAVHRAKERGGSGRLALVLTTLVVALPLLVVKYSAWGAESVEFVAKNLLGHKLDRLPWRRWPLPIGISFFTFQALAYVFDVAKGLKPEKKAWRFTTFIIYFPQLIAGPIVRAHELLPTMLDPPLLRRGMVGEGLFRIARGLAKKVLIADIVRLGMVDPIFEDPTRFVATEVLFALYAYTLQIYCDFSGYSDIAIGTGLLFGLKLPENFDRPYKATCVADFWRRWHKTLSSWLRDYIYFPMGGGRAGGWRVYFNIMVLMLGIAMWHGAAWNFVIYGALHGLAVCYCRWRRKTTGRRPGTPLASRWGWTWRFLGTFHFVVICRILFRARGFAAARQVALGLLRSEAGQTIDAIGPALGRLVGAGPAALMPRFSLLAWSMFALGWLIHASPSRWQPWAQKRFIAAGPMGWAGGFLVLGALCLLLGSGEQLAFVYYQF